MVPRPTPEPVVIGSGALLAGRYRLGGLLGVGGMSDVHAAEDEYLRRAVAVKLLRVHHADSGDRRRFEMETRTLAGLRHPGLVALFDASTVQDPAGRLVPFLVMELVEGMALSARLSGDGGLLAVEEVAALGAEVAETLAYIHDRGVVHRDIKPANILLDSAVRGRVPFRARLADFGISRLVDATRITQHGLVVGTPAYSSPEQAAGVTVGPTSDVYSLGLVLIECLTGQSAFPESGGAVAALQLQRPPAVPSAAGPGWAWLLTAMTAADPAARPTAGQVADALHDAGPGGPDLGDISAGTAEFPSSGTAPGAPGTVPQPTTAPEGREPVRRPIVRPRPRVVDTAVLVLVALAAATYLLTLLVA